MNIYTPITPTRLYIKQHSITKKKYFGKTTIDNPIKYLGSGVYWTAHINKHDRKFVETIWLSDLYYDTSIVEHALHFSTENDIVESDAWANLKPENGLEGGFSGPHTPDSKIKISNASKNRIWSDETRQKISFSVANLPKNVQDSLSKSRSDSKKEWWQNATQEQRDYVKLQSTIYWANYTPKEKKKIYETEDSKRVRLETSSKMMVQWHKNLSVEEKDIRNKFNSESRTAWWSKASEDIITARSIKTNVTKSNKPPIFCPCCNKKYVNIKGLQNHIQICSTE